MTNGNGHTARHGSSKADGAVAARARRGQMLRLIGASLAACAAAIALPAVASATMVTFSVVNARGIAQLTQVLPPGHAAFVAQTDPYGKITLDVAAGDHVSFSRDGGYSAGPASCLAPEDPSQFAGQVYVVPATPIDATITLPNATGASYQPDLSNTESWIIGKLNQERAVKGISPPLAVSSTLMLAADAMAHDLALSRVGGGYAFPPPHCMVTTLDWGWPSQGFLFEDSPYADPSQTLAHWDGSDGTAESAHLAQVGAFSPSNTAVGIGDGGGSWIIQYNACPTLGADRCGMTANTGDPTAYTPPVATPPGPGAGGGGSPTVAAITGKDGGGSPTVAAITGTQSLGGGSLSLGSSSGPAAAVAATSNGATVSLHCSGAANASCRGVVSLVVRERMRGARVLAVLAKVRTRTVKATVGSASYMIAARQIKTVTVVLNAAGRRLLKRFHHLRVAVIVSVSTASGTSQLTSKTVTIKLPSGRRKK